MDVEDNEIAFLMCRHRSVCTRNITVCSTCSNCNEFSIEYEGKNGEMFSNSAEFVGSLIHSYTQRCLSALSEREEIRHRSPKKKPLFKL